MAGERIILETGVNICPILRREEKIRSIIYFLYAYNLHVYPRMEDE